MRHIFIINPTAGSGHGGGHGHRNLIDQISETCERRGTDYDIHVTTHIGDATETVRTMCTATAEPIRFYACGGDGTLSEVLVGMADAPHAELGLIPCGTGNDFARNFSDRGRFFDIDAQLDGESIPIDLLMANDRPCINMINIGFDCEVVCRKDEYNRRPHFPHKLAYVAGVASVFFKMPGIRARISIDGGEEQEVDLQLTTLANGECCGGGFHSNPRAMLQGGMIDVLQILPVSRITFLRLIGSYKAGTHLDGHKNDKIVHAFKCRSLRMTFPQEQNICIDGDVTRVHELSLTLRPEAVRFACPRGVTLLHPASVPAPTRVPTGATV